MVTFDACEGDLASASRLSLLWASGALQGEQWQRGQVEKGRPLRLMRVNGRSGGLASDIPLLLVYTSDGDGGVPLCLQEVTRWPRMQASQARF